MTQLEFLRQHFPKIAEEFEKERTVETDILSEGFPWYKSKLGHRFWRDISSLVYFGINQGIEFVRQPIKQTCIEHKADHLL